METLSPPPSHPGAASAVWWGKATRSEACARGDPAEDGTPSRSLLSASPFPYSLTHGKGVCVCGNPLQELRRNVALGTFLKLNEQLLSLEGPRGCANPLLGPGRYGADPGFGQD